MRIEKVAKMKPLDRFIYWIKERHQIYQRREVQKKPKPWTDDEILQNYFFTNPYRENDKVTIWVRDKIRYPLMDHPRLVFALICFRWFNYIPTGMLLIKSNLLLNWDLSKALRILGQLRRDKQKIFTGAFMINSPGGEPKLEAICRRINNVWMSRKGLEAIAQDWETLEEAHKTLKQFDGIGGFMAYEVVCDLRHTPVLSKATDKDTWCNPGPGAIRGLYRLAGLPLVKKRRTGLVSNSTSPPKPKDWLKQMVDLLAKVRLRLPDMPKFELREIEHSLCEFDKYERALAGDGRLKRRYDGA